MFTYLRIKKTSRRPPSVQHLATAPGSAVETREQLDLSHVNHESAQGQFVSLRD